MVAASRHSAAQLPPKTLMSSACSQHGEGHWGPWGFLAQRPTLLPADPWPTLRLSQGFCT